MRIVTWNVNSIRSRRDRVVGWLKRAHWGVDQWNGVAILSRVGLDEVERGFRGMQRPPYDEARVLSATCGGLRVHKCCWPEPVLTSDHSHEAVLLDCR